MTNPLSSPSRYRKKTGSLIVLKVRACLTGRIAPLSILVRKAELKEIPVKRLTTYLLAERIYRLTGMKWTKRCC